ncbi:hypothetical protein roselon_01679 [Roseibacterium elongatum DSM 19469]|uniref:Uncharacterized protein n=1 Tax=Roseicyclus elongatus DSM 19469 TaxID=1294273 RepID=W8S5F2_9RHOB|nr:hypothetical protein [Roseibacterium elongatum]AHM04056.1 hypothetical protein roselon_01679 [Roseibacterium elongatum DSM 19469]
MRRLFLALTATALCAPVSAQADDITDALSAAIAAYENGEIQDALGEIAYATQLLNELQAEGLETFLPAALDGWTRTISDESATALGFMGGGSAAEASYSGAAGSFTVTYVADNPMVGAMAGMLGNASLMAAMGRIERINGENFLQADGELSALIGGRVLIQASGSPTEAMIAHLEQVDFDALGSFSQ